MKLKVFASATIVALLSFSASAANYLISPSATTNGAAIAYKNVQFKVGTTAFSSFSAFVVANPAANSTVYVASGTYSENVTISTAGLNFVGANAFGDSRTSTRTLAESIITGKLTINANNVTINGFRFTGNGCVVNSAATVSSPLSGLKFIYNIVDGATLAHNLSTAVLHLGTPRTNDAAIDASVHCIYQNITVSHNEFKGSASNTAHFVVVAGGFGTCYYTDNTFDDGGCSIALYNTQGTNYIRYNTFKNVGDFTRASGSDYGEFAIRLFYIAYANTTKIHIDYNDFDNCQGQSSMYSCIRFYNGDTSHTIMTPVGCTINVHHNIFRNKPKHSSANYNYVFYTNYTEAATIYARLNTFDNSELCFGFIKQKGESSAKRLFASSAGLFDVGTAKSSIAYHKYQGGSTDFKNMKTKCTRVCQNFDLDNNGTIYTCQICDDLATSLGIHKNSLMVTHFYTDSETGEIKKSYMYLQHAGHGSGMALCRFNGTLYIVTGGKSTTSGSSETPTTTTFIPWKANAKVDVTKNSFTVDGTTYNIKHFVNSWAAEDISSWDGQYPAIDLENRLFCERMPNGKVWFAIYDLDDVFNNLNDAKPLKNFGLTKKDSNYKFTSSSSTYTAYANADKGLQTWPMQGFTVSGDYLYLLEGVGEDGYTDASGNNYPAVNNEPTIFMTVWNWRTDKFAYRKPIVRSVIKNLVHGEPEGVQVYRDDVGRSHLLIGVSTGASGDRAENIFEFSLDTENGMAMSVPTGVITPKVSSVNLTNTSTSSTFNVGYSSQGGNDRGSLNARPIYTIAGTDGQCFSCSVENDSQWDDPYSIKVKVTVTYTPDGLKKNHTAKLRISSVGAADAIITLNGTDNSYVAPSLTANPTSESFSTIVGNTQAKTIAISGTKMPENVTLALSGTNASLFSLSANSLASSGGTVTVTYSPTTAGSHSATLTAKSGTYSITVALSGTATEQAVPSLTASDELLSFTAEEESSTTETVTFTGENLSSGIALSLSGDDASLFSISDPLLGASGGTVTVTYSPTEAGSHFATLTAMADGVAPVSVTLEGTATEKPDVPIVDPTLFVFTKVMESQNVPSDAGNCRFSTGYDGYLYTVDRTNSQIVRYNMNGVKSVFANIEGTPWTAITSDDAGNILINQGSAYGTNTAANWFVFEPDGTQHTLTLTMPDGMTNGRIDAVGRAFGNVLGINGQMPITGALCVLCKDSTKAAIFYLKNGEQVSAKTVETGFTADATAIGQPSSTLLPQLVSNPEDYYLFRLRTNKSITTRALPRTSSDGFDVFTLGDKTYIVEPTGASNYGDGYTIHELGSDDVLAEREETVTDGTVKYQSLTARVSDDGSYATIYQNVSGQLVSIYNFGMPSTRVDAIGEEVIETSHVFYNLQGMRIDRPTAGQIVIRVATLSDGSISTSKIVSSAAQ